MSNQATGTEIKKSELRSVIKYADISSVLTPFMDVKAALWKAFSEDEEANKLTLENPLALSKFVKKLEKQLGITDSRLVDFSEREDTVSEALDSFMEKISVSIDNFVAKVSILVDEPKKVTIYQYQSRGASLTSEMMLSGTSSFEMMNAFCPYASERWTLAFDFGDFKVALMPEAAAGIKGSGELYVYVWENGRVFKDVANKYLKEKCEATKLFRG